MHGLLSNVHPALVVRSFAGAVKTAIEQGRSLYARAVEMLLASTLASVAALGSSFFSSIAVSKRHSQSQPLLSSGSANGISLA